MTKLSNKFDAISLNRHQINIFNEMMFSFLTVQQADSQEVLTEKMNALKSFRSFLEQFVHFKALGSRESKLNYMDFLDKLNDQIYELELLTGVKTLESVQRAGRRFAKKTQFPLGIIE